MIMRFIKEERITNFSPQLMQDIGVMQFHISAV